MNQFKALVDWPDFGLTSQKVYMGKRIKENGSEKVAICNDKGEWLNFRPEVFTFIDNKCPLCNAELDKKKENKDV